MVTDEQIYNIVTDNIEVATDKLIDKANEAGRTRQYKSNYSIK